MPILNYTTQIAAEKTIAEITKILVAHGATKLITDYNGMGLPRSVTFCLNLGDKMVAYCLPANYDGVLKAMKRQNIPRKLVNDEQALRVSWRIVKDWVEAQCAIVEANLAEMAEVFLPYAVTKSGTTLFKYMSEGDGSKLLN